MTRVVLAEDDPCLVRGLGTALGESGYEVVTATDGATTVALALVGDEPPSLVILNLRLGA